MQNKQNLAENPAEEMVTITRKKYEKLSKDASFLCALECAGVDNWDGYEDAQNIFREWDEGSNQKESLI